MQYPPLETIRAFGEKYSQPKVGKNGMIFRCIFSETRGIHVHIQGRFGRSLSSSFSLDDMKMGRFKAFLSWVGDNFCK